MPDGRNGDRSGPAVDAIDDEVFVALRNRHRRYTLYFLDEHDCASVDELADVLAGWEALESGVTTREDRTDFHAALVHRHLPLLEAAGLIDREDTVVRRSNWQEPVPAFVKQALERETGSHGS